MPEMKHLYAHVPFCRTPCAYCDFASEPVGPHARAGRVVRYLKALREELEERAGCITSLGGRVTPETETVPPGADRVPRGGEAAPRSVEPASTAHGSFETVYLGGGTPTVIAPELLLPLIRDLATWLAAAPGVEAPLPAAAGAAPGARTSEPDASAPLGGRREFTIEANPGTVDAPLLQDLAAAGVTRLSLGVQSFAPALRAALGRRVSQREIEKALAAIALTGWGEWNIDLVFGIPGQTWSDAAADIDAAVAARPTHVSLYDLTYTTAFRTRVDVTLGAGARKVAGAFAEQHYAAAVARLEAAGYRRYEVSNFALPGHECRHNQAYWQGEDYLGIGASAVTTLGGERRTNPRSVGDYLAGRPAQIEELSPETKLWEKAMLGLRTSDGVEEAAVLPVVDRAARDRLLAQGCLERRYGKLRVNPGFLDVSNTVIGALLIHPGES
jgi:oxygen-independent coproporphyrinogen-3 oxidase